MAAALVGGFVGALFFGWWTGAIIAAIMGWFEYRKGVAYGVTQGRTKKRGALFQPGWGPSVPNPPPR
jgi:hypothetical protein